MTTLNDTYSREQALFDGLLLDLAELVPESEAGIPYPAAVSAGLWNLRDINRDSERLDLAVRLAASKWKQQGCPLGKLEQLIFMRASDNEPYAISMHVQVFVEPSAEHGKIVTFVSGYEDYDLRCPRPQGGTFHTV